MKYCNKNIIRLIMGKKWNASNICDDQKQCLRELGRILKGQ